MTLLSDAGKMFGNIRQTCASIKSRIPLLKRLHLNFISLHYAYIIACALICSIIIYPSSGIEYVDAIFLSACAATQSGLNTVDLNLLYTYQQVILWFISMISNPIVIHSFVVFVRLYSFEKRFQHLARDARSMRRTRSRSGTVTRGRDGDIDSEERGVGGRRIVVLRNNAGEARGKYIEEFPEVMKPDPETAEGAEVPEVPKDDSTQSSDTRENAPAQDGGAEAEAGGPEPATATADDDTTRAPNKKDNEHHIAFLVNQRSDRGALRIPSPREYDRGGGPQALDDDGEDLSRKFTTQSEHPQTRANRDSTTSAGPQQSSGPHITIDEPNIARSRARTTTFTRANTARSDDTSGEEQESSNPLSRLRSRKPTLSTLFSAKSREDHDPMPYLSWHPTIGRNSAFVDLTEAQRDELGGIEYRALKTLAVILIGYFVCFHLLGVVCLVPWVIKSTRYSAVVNAAGQDRTWWGIFTAGSSFNDVGFTLTPDSMISFQEAFFPLLLMTFLIVIGNTGFPCMLRFIIWVLSKIARKGGVLWEELHFLLDHPRRTFTLLFPRAATWWLFAVLVILNGVDLIFFIILDLNDPDITAIPAGARVVDGLFQASATRTAGFSVISLSELHPATQVSYLIMMYISVFPIAISMRRTNVYEERSLGVYSNDDDDDEEGDGNNKEPSYVGAHLRKQLSFDLWYISLGLFFIAIVEGKRLQNMNNSSFTLYSVLFEIISAYGTVGLSLGYPGSNTSFCGQFKPLSKLIIVAMQIRGRHRGLPYKLDRAVLLPSEALHKKELADAERRMRRRNSNVSSFSTLAAPQGQQQSQQGNDNSFRPETASSTGWTRERIPNGALGESNTSHHRFLGGMVSRLATHNEHG